MATTVFVNRARMLTSTTGTGSSVTLTTAVDGYFSLGEAGLENGDVVDYIIEQGSDFEIQHDQTYSDDGMGTVTLSRGTPAQSKVGGTAGTSQIELNGTAQVAIVAVAKSLDVSTFTEKSAPALTDLLWGHDSAAGVRKFFTLANLFKSSTVNLQVFTSNGTYTPTAGMRYALVIATAGGGGGGGADVSANGWASSGGGGAGATAIRLFTASEIGASQSVTVGAGGTAGSVTGSNGGDGGDTTFGSFMTAGGGTGGKGAVGAAGNAQYGDPGEGGTASGGTLNIAGGDGGPGQVPVFVSGHTMMFVSGVGGASWWGGGGGSVVTHAGRGTSFAGRGGGAYGSGGSGAVNDAVTAGRAGGAGAAGIVVVLEFC